jgi:hypothetical protein
MKCAAALWLVLVLVGCGGHRTVVASPANDRVVWARELGTYRDASDPELLQKVEAAASASGARLLDVRVLALSQGQHVPVVTLEAADSVLYLRQNLQGFLNRIGYFEPDALAFVELLEEDGHFAWAAGRFPNGGMVHTRPDLDQWSPIAHWQTALVSEPPRNLRRSFHEARRFG